MLVVDEPPVLPLGPGPQERAWRAAEAVAVDVMGTVNVEVARLVSAVRSLLLADAWVGFQSPEHWVSWKASVCRHRAEGLVRIARRADQLPRCWALFEAGQLGEDAMVRIARRVPSDRDAEVAALSPELTIAQLDRLLASLPELPDPDTPPKSEPERSMELRTGRDGWTRGRFCLPADEGALVQTGLTAARDAEFRDRNDIDPDTEIHPDLPDEGQRRVTWADGLVRLATAAIDALDGTLQRTGSPGDRHQIVLHCDIDPDGQLGPGQLEYGPVIPDWMARYLSCDAKTLHAAYAAGALAGIEPGERHPNRKLRRYLARRDQGCRHPLCRQRRWLHAHHLVFWEDGGLTLPQNLVMLCPAHHRALHRGEFSIDGNPEAGTLVFRDRFGQPITPPHPRPPGSGPPGARPPGSEPPPRGDPSSPYSPPSAERIDWRDFNWN
jgi:hypothetical protein